MADSIFSPLVSQICPLSDSHHYIRTKPISAVVIHHTAGVVYDGKNVVQMWETNNPYSSSTYIIDVSGRITGVVPEYLRPYTSSSWGLGSRDIDNRAITIEVSNDVNSDPWSVSRQSIDALIELLADIGIRYKIKAWKWTGNESGNIHAHRWYGATGCPGDWFYARFGEIASKANKKMADIIKEKIEMAEDNIKKLNEVATIVDQHVKVKYNTFEEIPKYWKPEFEYLIDKGYLKGTDNGYQLSWDAARQMAITARAIMAIEKQNDEVRETLNKILELLNKGTEL